jgi:tRNA G10  N-methylase Trm11
MKYLFILGRNVELSVKEVLCFLERFDYRIVNFIEKDNSLLVDIEGTLRKGSIDKLGGVIAIGEVMSEGNVGDVLSDLEKHTLYAGSSNKLNYVIWNYGSEDYLEIATYLKKRFHNEKLKATEKRLTGKVELQTGGNAPTLKSSLIDEQFFIFSREAPHVDSEEFYFGKIIEYCDYDKLEKRDMEKPSRRSELAISPRLSKIMINLSQVKKGELLDCFCGIGVILYEALLQGMGVVGVEIDKKAIEGARKNLVWAKFDSRKYDLVNRDSKKVSIKDVEVLVTEPDLGETFKKIPPEVKINNSLENFGKLMIDVLNNLKKNVSGRVVFTAPYVLTHKKDQRKGCDIDEILEKTGLKLVDDFPIAEFRKGQVVGRQIFVLE